jgi:hypothetical protein
MPSFAIVPIPSGARQQILYHLSASSRNLPRATTIRNRHLPNSRHPRFQHGFNSRPPQSLTVIVNQSLYRTCLINGDVGADWKLGCLKEDELKQAEACRKETIDMKFRATFWLGMPNE